MANTVLTPGHKFPPATSVKAYPLRTVEQRIAPPQNTRPLAPLSTAAAVETVSVVTAGTLTFTTLTSGEQYAAHATVSGEERWLRFQGT